VLGILIWESGGAAVGALIAVGLVALGSLVGWLKRRKREGKPALLDVGLFSSKYFRLGISGQTLQQIALGGMMIALPIYLQMVLEYNAMEAGLSLAPLSLTMFAIALLAGRKAGNRSPSRIIQIGFLLLSAWVLVLIPIVPRADSGWAMALPLVVAGAGLGLLVSQLNNYTLAPIEEEHVSEAAGVNSAGGSFGLSFGLAFAGAIMRPPSRSCSRTRRSRATCSPRLSSSRVLTRSSTTPKCCPTPSSRSSSTGNRQPSKKRSCASTRMRGR
jgi:Major Facilitator Superfamily